MTHWIISVQDHHSMQKKACEWIKCAWKGNLLPEMLPCNQWGLPSTSGWQGKESWTEVDARSQKNYCEWNCIPALQQTGWLKFNDPVSWKQSTVGCHAVRKHSSLKHYKRPCYNKLSFGFPDLALLRGNFIIRADLMQVPRILEFIMESKCHCNLFHYYYYYVLPLQQQQQNTTLLNFSQVSLYGSPGKSITRERNIF